MLQQPVQQNSKIVTSMAGKICRRSSSTRRRDEKIKIKVSEYSLLGVYLHVAVKFSLVMHRTLISHLLSEI